MPQLDFDALITARSGEGSDRRIPCKTPVDNFGDGDEFMSEDEDDHIAVGQYDIVHPDDPPESFWLSKDAEYDWLDRNAFYERKDSTRGNSTNLNPHVKATSFTHNSQRFSGNLRSKTSMIGLPRTQKATFVDSGCRRTCKSSKTVRLFPKRPAGKSAVAVTEPGSPKVSCTGRVRSKRGRRRLNLSRRSEKLAEKSGAGHEKQAAEESKTVLAKETKKKMKKAGFYSKVMSIFRSKKTHKKPSRSNSRKAEEAQTDKPAAVETPGKSSARIKTASEPPGLGGMKRFASGRQSGSWLAEDLSQVYPDPIDFDRRVSLTGRR